MRIFCIALTAFLLVVSIQRNAAAAIGCTLSNPAQDLKYLFPEMSSYKEEIKEFSRLSEGKTLYEELGIRIGGDLDPVYEAFETPFTVYSVFRGETLIGIVHGVNVPGRGGVIQVFLSVDPATGVVRQLFFQRLESGAAKALRNAEFRNQFAGLSLADFYKHDYFAVAGSSVSGTDGSINTNADKLESIKPPAGIDDHGVVDFDAAMRGIRKNLILLDFFVFGRKSEPYFKRAQEALKGKK